MSQTLYYIAVLIPEPAAAHIQRFQLEMHETYGTYAALKSPPHITLIPPFHFSQQEELVLQEALQVATTAQKSFPLTLQHFDCFPPQTIFIDVAEQPALHHLQIHVQEAFSNFLPTSLQKAPRFHPHVTVGNRDWKDHCFEQAWETWKTKSFTELVDISNISLLRLEDKKWNVIASAPLDIC